MGDLFCGFAKFGYQVFKKHLRKIYNNCKVIGLHLNAASGQPQAPKSPSFFDHTTAGTTGTPWVMVRGRWLVVEG